MEALADTVALYDALEQTLTPLESGMTLQVSGQTRNRYFLVSSLNPEKAAEETHLLIYAEGRTATVAASTQQPIVSVRCFDTGGRLVHQAAPQASKYTFTLPANGIYIIEASTEHDTKTKKVASK